MVPVNAVVSVLAVVPVNAVPGFCSDIGLMPGFCSDIGILPGFCFDIGTISGFCSDFGTLPGFCSDIDKMPDDCSAIHKQLGLNTGKRQGLSFLVLDVSTVYSFFIDLLCHL